MQNAKLKIKNAAPPGARPAVCRFAFLIFNF
jgi:hypothetical protein